MEIGMTAVSEIPREPSCNTLSRSIALTTVILGFVQTRYWLGLSLPLLAVSGLLIVLCLNNGNAPTLGLRMSPVQGWRYWCGFSAWFAIVIASVCAVVCGIWYSLGWTLQIPRTSPTMPAFIHMCIDSPVSEEVIFRALLTVAVLPLLGEWGTILLGGVVFALLHVIHGNPGPDNQLAGFMLGWAFLKSKTILVPLAMHSTGNLIALGIQIAAYYLHRF